MRAIITDLHTRLTAALPCPVLLPEQRELPLAGRKPGQSGGLGGYLAAHPGGYVQLEDAQGISDDGVTAVWWVPVAALAPTAEQSDALAGQVRRLLCGSPRCPGPYTPTLPDTARLVSPGVSLCRPSYQILSIDGVLAV
ncbi:hypothetical protein DEIPH_ctg052orf0018 [Deinococcus phoenicis]|uniref:Uncharacterized protein n=1 Tax=Deinococcus phoenicis TaxID=1476583 RepID=A0A016QLU8_9DEIO|nr:hypothetical protein [Deinococcus phoenicis]EYB67023.1 hypothetical protein DEIPH_ctg052orf0018 [Deinococcus phoenicis]